MAQYFKSEYTIYRAKLKQFNSFKNVIVMNVKLKGKSQSNNTKDLRNSSKQKA